ncbi:hypothetical protein DH2020_005225 [Rehmannia glutinosa]|uniref:RHOMBOID-like protein n=1 Tax=Rehmannia glutinosa TaxID=99300 RepID=A0ABR0W7R8_REHGL
MGRTPIGSSPESEFGIKVQPRQSDPHPIGGPSPYTPDKFRPLPPPPAPPRPYHASMKKWFPWLVPTIVTANIVIFIIVMYINDCPANSDDKCVGEASLGRFAFQSTHENPLLGPSAATLLNIGALEVKKVVQEHQAWRLVSLRVGLLYVISGIGGSLLSSLFVRNTISVGASGALFGLLGAMLSELLVNWTIYENKLESLLSLLLIILINMAVGILPHVDNFAHLGGFITGFLLGFVLLIRPQFGYINKKKAPGYIITSSKSKYKAYQCVFLIVSVILLTVGQYENQLNLTCMQNHKSKFYMLDGGISPSQIQKLCAELCH